MPCVCHSYANLMYSYVTHMSFVCHSYVLICYLHVLVCNGMSLACTRFLSVYYSYVLVCLPYVTRMYSYVIRMSFVCGFTVNLVYWISFHNVIFLVWTLNLICMVIWNSWVKNWVEKPNYGLWRHKTELSQTVTSKLIFRNSETLDWKSENKKTKLRNLEILLTV